ncbi:DoxX family protein [Sphingomonas sp. BT-65]|uniref:DoxX family protein n=1 Tax=Sphingomonas sp. BT-65 TaxID=2989821 RepID=UPI00223618FF|nr:DoxX family protein [Sphingomonas sp. BT-65]MCW4460394.1 DoxX family protein [Sphingomonas sp. BT-65]
MPIPASWSDKLLSVLRIVAGLSFLQHGTSKFFGLPPFPMEGPLPPMLITAGTIELVGGALLVLGLFTRPVAFIASGMCAVGYFIAHGSKGFFPAANGGEAILLFCFIFLYLAAAGGGAWSADQAMKKG